MTAGFRILPRAPSADSALLARLAKLPVSNVSDQLLRHHGARIRPLHRGGTMVGTAFTVKVPPGDNLMVHKAIDTAQPGDVIVVDAGGVLEQALIGELMASWARKRGVAGFVIDGAVRDSAFLSAWEYPVYAAGISHRGPYKNGPGEINVPVSIAGLVVHPGDLVAGDADGVIAVRPDDAAAVIAAAEAQNRKEAAAMEAIHAGTYDRKWVDEALAAKGVKA